MRSDTVALIVELAQLVLLAVVLPMVRRYLASRDKREAWTVIESAAQTVVDEAEDEVRALKTPAENDGGAWTPLTAARLRDRGIAFIKRVAARELAKFATRSTSADELSARALEAAVERARRARAAVAALPPTLPRLPLAPAVTFRSEAVTPRPPRPPPRSELATPPERPSAKPKP